MAGASGSDANHPALYMGPVMFYVYSHNMEQQVAILRKSLSTILGGFTKPLADLDAFVAQEQKQITIYDNNISKLEQMIDDQERKRNDSVAEIAEATAFGNRLKALVDGPPLSVLDHVNSR